MVAIKAISLMGQDASDVAARFINEARSAAGCTHPNVVTVFDYGRKLETAYIVMERLPGPDLQTLVARGDRLPIDQVLEYTEQALKGLGAAHDVDLMHRDIKPANLVLSKDGTVKIVDFGIAKFTQSSTVSGQLSGTIGYMAPERFEGGDASRQGDLYSLGCTMVTLLAVLAEQHDEWAEGRRYLALDVLVRARTTPATDTAPADMPETTGHPTVALQRPRRREPPQD